MSLLNYSATYTDLYQLTMAEVYFSKGRKDEFAVFDYSFRKLPFKGGYVIFSGLEDLLRVLQDLAFTDDDIKYLKTQGFGKAFLEYLEGFRFKGNIFSFREGDVVFPLEPILQVEGHIIEAQIIETLLLNHLNYQSLVATKASRMRQVAEDTGLIDFGLRRSHGPAGYYASRAAVVGGFDATSHVKSGCDFNIPVSGTMAHSFIQSYEDELTAFRDYAAVHGDHTVLLVDTYDTLGSGVPNAITIGRELAEQEMQLKAIRLDSGDLAYLAKESRKILDKAGLAYVQIVASNQLDEYVIKSLLEQNAPIDIFGVGTSLVTGQPDGALDGVYKLSECAGRPSIKLSENMIKTTLPHKKQVFRSIDKNENYLGLDTITMRNENQLTMATDPFDPRKSHDLSSMQMIPMLSYTMKNGKPIHSKKKLSEIAEFSKAQLKKLPVDYKRFENPHKFKVGVGPGLLEERNKLMEKYHS